MDIININFFIMNIRYKKRTVILLYLFHTNNTHYLLAIKEQGGVCYVLRAFILSYYLTKYYVEKPGYDGVYACRS